MRLPLRHREYIPLNECRFHRIPIFLFIRVADTGRGAIVVERTVTTPISQPQSFNPHILGSPLRPMNTRTEGSAALVRPPNCPPELADFMAAMDRIEADYSRRCTT
jgi:hypothetical protein